MSTRATSGVRSDSRHSASAIVAAGPATSAPRDTSTSFRASPTCQASSTNRMCTPFNAPDDFDDVACGGGSLCAETIRRSIDAMTKVQLTTVEGMRSTLAFLGDHRLQGCEELWTGKGFSEKARNLVFQGGQRLVARDHNNTHVLEIQLIDQAVGTLAVSQIDVDERHVRIALRQ